MMKQIICTLLLITLINASDFCSELDSAFSDTLYSSAKFRLKLEKLEEKYRSISVEHMSKEIVDGVETSQSIKKDTLFLSSLITYRSNHLIPDYRIYRNVLGVDLLTPKEKRISSIYKLEKHGYLQLMNENTRATFDSQRRLAVTGCSFKGVGFAAAGVSLTYLISSGLGALFLSEDTHEHLIKGGLWALTSAAAISISIPFKRKAAVKEDKVLIDYNKNRISERFNSHCKE